VASAAAIAAAAKRAISGETGTHSRGSALSRDSSLPGLKRENTSCHASISSRVAITASAAPSPSTSTVHAPPKHVNVRSGTQAYGRVSALTKSSSWRVVQHS
jgi:hypothetical protein